MSEKRTASNGGNAAYLGPLLASLKYRSGKLEGAVSVPSHRPAP